MLFCQVNGVLMNSELEVRANPNNITVVEKSARRHTFPFANHFSVNDGPVDAFAVSNIDKRRNVGMLIEQNGVKFTVTGGYEVILRIDHKGARIISQASRIDANICSLQAVLPPDLDDLVIVDKEMG